MKGAGTRNHWFSATLPSAPGPPATCNTTDLVGERRWFVSTSELSRGVSLFFLRRYPPPLTMSLLLLLLLSASTQLATDAAAFMPLQNLGAVHLHPIATALPLHHRPLRTRSKFGFRMLLQGEGQGAGAAADVQDHECIEWRFIRHNKWHCYDANASRLLEAALAAGENSATLSLNTSSSASTSPGGACEYVVTFDSPDSGTFSQVNIHSGHIRAVRRAPASAFCQPVVPEFDLAPRLEPMITAALSNAEPLLLRGGTFVLREEVRLGANGAHLRIRGPGKILGDVSACLRVFASVRI